MGLGAKMDIKLITFAALMLFTGSVNTVGRESACALLCGTFVDALRCLHVAFSTEHGMR